MEQSNKPYNINIYPTEEERREIQDFFKRHTYLRRGGITKHLLVNFIRNNPHGTINLDSFKSEEDNHA